LLFNARNLAKFFGRGKLRRKLTSCSVSFASAFEPRFAMAAPTPLPTRLKLLRGNPGKRRLNLDEPQPASAPECPAPPSFLSAYAAEQWRRVAPELHRLGLLTILDETTLAAHCAACCRWHQCEEILEREGELVVAGSAGNRVPHPAVRIAVQAARDLIAFGREFGLTPSSRARVRAAEPQGGPSKFNGLLA
jgi:P27 family predicted phage terminase small subunit